MKAINKFTGDNLGGIAKLWAIPPTYIISILSIGNNMSQVQFSSTNNVYEIYFTFETSPFSESKQQTKAGIIYKPQITGIIPKNTPEIQQHIEYLERRKWMVIYEDQNGYFKLLGAKNALMTFDGNLNIPEEIKGLNKTMFTFKGEVPSRGLFIENPFSSL